MKLPLYTSTSTLIDESPSAAADPFCQRCLLGGAADVTCMRPAGKPGGLLVLGQAPTKKCADVGRPWASPGERNVARAIQRLAGQSYPVAFDYAVKCPGTADDEAIKECRPFLRQTIDTVKPERIIAFGGAAAKALFGNAAPTAKVRRCWAKLEDGTPVFFVPEPFHTQANHILSQWLREDLEWAVRVDVADLEPPTDAVYTMVEDEAEAERACEALLGAWHTFDVETYGVLFEPDFKIVALASAVFGDTHSWVWPEESMREGDPRRPWIEKLLREGQHVAHGAKYEVKSVLSHFGIDLGPNGIALDTSIAAKQDRADGHVGIDPLGYMIGMGGSKKEADAEIKHKLKILRAMRVAADKPVPVKIETQVRTNDVTGRKQRRKVVVESRPPTKPERREQAIAAWSKKRTSKGEKTTYAAQATNLHDWTAQDLLLDCPAISADWLHASLSPGDEWSYVYGLIDRPLCYRYNARDTVASSLLGAKLLPVIRNTEPYRKIYDSHMGRAPWAVAQVEAWGMAVDSQKLADLEIYFDIIEADLLKEIHTHAPGINPGSPDQLAELLFKKLKLVPLKFSAKTKKPSTDKTTLEHLESAHPIVPLIQKWKSVAKLNGTYARGLRSFIRSDGRIRCGFNITGTETGRMSCHDPNMQTIPSRGEYAKRVKNVFVAPEGYKLVQLDYKALEVRIAAMLSGDPILLDVFKRGEDPHKETAIAISEILWGNAFADCGGLTGDDLAAEQKRRRDVCKTIVFGTLYGQGTATLAQSAGITEVEAERAQEAVLGRYKVLRKWIDRVSREAQRSGETWTWWAGGKGRRRPVPDIGSADNQTAGHGRRQSYNTPVQGTGSEFCMASLVALVEWIFADGIDAKLVMTVHDSLVFECHVDDIAELVEQAIRIMTSWESGGVALDVDVETGDEWGDLSEYVLAEAA